LTSLPLTTHTIHPLSLHDALPISNAALRYTPPGTHREDLRPERGTFAGVSHTEPEQPAERRPASEAAPPHLAPGQKWDPSEQIRFVQPRRSVQRPGSLLVSNAERQPDGRRGV